MRSRNLGSSFMDARDTLSITHMYINTLPPLLCTLGALPLSKDSSGCSTSPRHNEEVVGCDRAPRCLCICLSLEPKEVDLHGDTLSLSFTCTQTLFPRRELGDLLEYSPLLLSTLGSLPWTSLAPSLHTLGLLNHTSTQGGRRYTKQKSIGGVTVPHTA